MSRAGAAPFTLTLTLLAMFAACRQGPSNAPPAPSNAPPASADRAAESRRPVARVGGETITGAELGTIVGGELGKLEAEHAQKVYELKSQGLASLVDQRLIAAKAKAEGMTPEKLSERELAANQPSAAEVTGFYEQVKSRSGGQVPPLEAVKGEIGNMLARKKWVEGLRAATKVETLLPPLRLAVGAEGPAKGPDKAPVTIVEFSDFECPFCSRAEETVKQVLSTYGDKVRLVFRDFPLPFHPKAQKASEAALCAGDEGKYWQMHERLFSNQQALGVPELKGHAKAVGLDAAKFDACLDSGKKAALVEASKKAGESVGVTGTPAFFINGRPLHGAVPFEEFKKIIDSELAPPATN